MKKIKPRKYQKDVVEKALKNRRKRTLIVSPGGSGKTVMIAYLCKLELEKGKKILCFSHRREHINQAYTHLLRFGIDEEDIGTIMSNDDRSNPKAPIQLASIDTLLRRRKDYPRADTLIMDEAHHVAAETRVNLVKHYKKANFYGFTATPTRLDRKGLRNVFDILIEAIKPSELLRKRWMARPKMYSAPPKYLPDLKGLKTVYGDYSPSSLQEITNRIILIDNIVDRWFKRAKNKTTLVYAVSIKHSKLIVKRFIKRGIKAEHLDGRTALEEREVILDRLEKGKTKILCSCDVVSEGYDIPQCEAIILARPTKSETLYIQQCNRGLRYRKGKTAIILDHAANYRRHGLPYIDREHSLEETEDKEVNKQLVKACPVCGFLSEIKDESCTECGHVYSKISRLSLTTEIKEELELVDDAYLRKWKKKITKIAKKNGRSMEWVEGIFKVYADKTVFRNL